MPSEKTMSSEVADQTEMTFGAADLEPIGVQVSGFRAPDPEDTGKELLAVRVQFTGLVGYLFEWQDEYAQDSSGPHKVVRNGIIQSLKELLERVESNSHVELGTSVH